MKTTPEMKRVYSNIQKQLFYLIPEKWDRIYLYASVTQKIMNLETGELFFYYFPSGILKKNPINVYEIPNRFTLNEEEYIKLVERLYQSIKELWKLCKDTEEKVWTNITIKLVGLKFEIEYHYDDLSISPYSNIERHIIWKYKYLDLPIDSFNRKDKKLIEKYLVENVVEDLNDVVIYSESIYKRPIKNIVDYNKATPPQEFILVEKEQEEQREKERRKIEEQRYTYLKKEKRGLKRINKRPREKEMTYVEQIEAQRKAVKSQILNHL